jgi:phosphoglycolate phosphatase-like HAD superfamily hydrolase
MATLAVDCDGVLLDYNAAYAVAWQRTFGETPKLRNPHAYWAVDRWSVRKLDGAELAHFRSVLDEEFWSTIPAATGALEACEILTGMDLELVCVTAMEPHFQTARVSNLQTLGFPIQQVIATAGTVNGGNPKAAALNTLQPVAFVDDFAPYLVGIGAGTHLALIDRNPVGSPNTDNLQQEPHSRHPDLLGFARWWKRKNSL